MTIKGSGDVQGTRPLTIHPSFLLPFVAPSSLFSVERTTSGFARLMALIENICRSKLLFDVALIRTECSGLMFYTKKTGKQEFPSGSEDRILNRIIQQVKVTIPGVLNWE